MADAEAAPPLHVEVCYSPRPRTVWRWQGELPAGSTLALALEASGVLRAHPEIDLAQASLGIWGRRRPADAMLRDGDRVEVYRPLEVDPKEARRLRYRRHRETLAQRAKR